MTRSAPVSRTRRLSASSVRSGASVGSGRDGHRHAPYYFQQSPLTPFPVICAGSSTQTGLWSYGEYTIEGDRLQALRRVYNPAKDQFEDAESFALTLPVK